MTPLSIQVPFPVFQDRDGQPLDNGYVWLGEANLNPQTNPVIAYFDAALTIIAAQPLRTINGYISRAGTPAQVYVDGVNFSILVQDSKGTMVYNFPDGSGISPNASGVVYDPAGTSAVPTTVQAKLRESVSVLDFGAVGDGVTDDTTAIQAAVDYIQSYGASSDIFSNGLNKTNFGGSIYIPKGVYKITNKIVIAAVGQEAGVAAYAGITIYGDSDNASVIDASSLSNTDDCAIEVLGSFTAIKKIQILNSTGHGIKFEAAAGAALWMLNVKDVLINKPSLDGLYFGRCFLTTVDNCVVWNAPGYGFSFNGFHTSLKITHNYAVACNLGGYLIGERTDVSLSQGCVYSELTSNACDGGITAYAIHGARGVTMSGNGCEVISGDAIYITGTSINVNIDAFFATQVTGHGVRMDGTNAQVVINNYVDNTPTNLTTPLFNLNGLGASAKIASVNNTRDVFYTGFCSFNIDKSYLIRVVAFLDSSPNGVIGTIKNDSLNNVNINGRLTLTVSPEVPLNTILQQGAIYDLLVSINAVNKMVYVTSAGSTANTGAPIPGFTFSIDGSNQLIATRTFTGTLDTRKFNFNIFPTGNIIIV